MDSESTLARVLFVDDDEEVRRSHTRMLELEDFTVIAHAGGESAMADLSGDWPGIVVTDVKMPAMTGLELLARIRQLDADLPVVLLTGHGDVDMAVSAMQNGAYDFIEKPANPERFIETVRRACEKRTLVLENRSLREQLARTDEIDSRIIGRSPLIASLRDKVSHLANADIDVLIEGETGTGKELIARCLHDFGVRRHGPFVAVNCGAIPEHLVESELFGHEAGAFTGAAKRRIGKVEHASGGTLFLDELESTPLPVQIKLLRVLEERAIERVGNNTPVSVDLRVVAAAKGVLNEAIANNLFREDLFYRLNVATVSLPPLRERPEDVALLLRFFADLAAERLKRPPPELSAGLLASMAARDWPGNVRELRNVADVLALGLPLEQSPDPQSPGGDLHAEVAAFEKRRIESALMANEGRVGVTAESLGLPRKALYLRMRKYNIDATAFRS